MFRKIYTYIYVTIIVTLILTGCAGKSPTTGTSQPGAQETYAPVIDPASFVTVIDNPYLPMKPGTTFVYEGKTEKGNEHNETYISSETKVIKGVTCIVVKDKVLVDGVLEEATLDWYAQDKQGNVWYFGEDSKDYNKDGSVTSTAGSWEAGVNGALPGIVMQANPNVGETYRQEYYKGEAEDWASVLSLSESLTVPTGTYSNVLMTNEWSGLDNPPIYEHKYYAAGIGFIKTVYLQGGYELQLIEIR
jgi:hypothetical protein